MPAHNAGNARERIENAAGCLAMNESDIRDGRVVSQRTIGSGNKGSALERIHVTTDARTGDEKYIDTVPGSIPPRPVKPPAKPR